jgi:hypothetical protein
VDHTQPTPKATAAEPARWTMPTARLFADLPPAQAAASAWVHTYNHPGQPRCAGARTLGPASAGRPAAGVECLLEDLPRQVRGLWPSDSLV